jgi:predicted nucleic acid-binding protein
MISNVIYGILGVLTAIFYALFSWQKHKTKKAEKKLEDKEQELATEKVKNLETETVKEAVQHEKEIDQKEVENEQAIQETQDDSETLDAINTMLDKFNRRV